MCWALPTSGPPASLLLHPPKPPFSPGTAGGGCKPEAGGRGTGSPAPDAPRPAFPRVSVGAIAPDLILIRLRRCRSVILRQRICTDIVFSAFFLARSQSLWAVSYPLCCSHVWKEAAGASFRTPGSGRRSECALSSLCMCLYY